MKYKNRLLQTSGILSSLNGIKNLRLIGVEPIIFGAEIQHFIQLSYKRLFKLKV